MNRPSKNAFLTISFAALVLVPVLCAEPQGRPIPVIREGVNENRLATLSNNTRPEATPANDLGRVPDEFPMEHMLLQLKRSPEREAALESYIEGLHDSASPDFHQWLTPADFNLYYGVAPADVDVITGWLKSHGFTVHGIQPSGLLIDFSGTAGLVRQALHTEIHNLNVNGVKHFANMSDPEIPVALAPVVTGVVSLHNFHPKPMLVPRGNYTFTGPGGVVHALVPGDLAAIYNLAPLFAAGYSGKGQSIMVLEDTYLFSAGDWTTFRNTLGLSAAYPSGAFSQVSPQGAMACANPGFQGLSTDPGYGDDGEAAIDVEWATAAAPNAAIILAACTDTTTNFGGLIALENVLNGPSAGLPSVISISYGEAEAFNGAAANAAYKTAYQQAVAEGVSIFVSSGDQGAASSDFGNLSTRGISVSGFTSTPYNVSVGGTDFGYVPENVPASTYWSATNTATFKSALSYIPEIPWNDSCAGGLVASFLGPILSIPGLTPVELCNNVQVAPSNGGLHFLLNAVGGSGGPSGCASGAPATDGVVSGTCAGYTKPAFQSGLAGNPADGVRDVPDVSLFASNGFWDAYYVVCWSNPDHNVGGGFTCTGAPDTWAGFGGTSVSSPIMAGIQALVNQKTKSRWGNPNTMYYALAKAEYALNGAGAVSCNSNAVNKTSNTCIFYDITKGDNDVACAGSGPGSTILRNCFRPAGDTYGVLSTSNTADSPAYTAKAAWDFTTGIGSVNARNLVMDWPTAPAPSSGNACDGAFNGTFQGNLTVSAGQNCVFVGGGVTGNVMQNGGNLVLIGATIGGNLQVQGGGTFSLASSTNIQGNLQIQNLPASSAQNQVCDAIVKGNLQLQNSAAPIAIGAASACPGNEVGGNLQINNNTAAVAVFDNTVTGDLQVQNDTAPTMVFGNSVRGNLQCGGNATITGGGNTSSQKQGQCASF